MPTKILPAYLFLGEEDFLKEEAVIKLKSNFLSSQTIELNYSVFYAKEKDFDLAQMLDSLNTLPFLSKKRLVVLKDADSLPAHAKESILSYLRSPKESSIFIIETRSPGIKGEFLLAISRLAHLVYYRKLTDPGLNAWLTKKSASSGKKISVEALRAIKENLPNNLRILSSGMDNILLYTGRRNLITKGDVEKVMGVSPSHTAFDLINSIEERNARRALHIFSFLKKDKKRETELLGLLAWNARMILRVKELLRIKAKHEMRREFGLSPARLDQFVRQASGFKRSRIQALLDEILKADIDIKTGSSPTIVMERLIVKMCS
ncbi:MAG: DNA polymerase III subunit delta [Candidatus Omnitrophica bacterium]|nr:DNA polymerase III subunit delta [Candidatus Omnitrophota bacterium]